MPRRCAPRNDLGLLWSTYIGGLDATIAHGITSSLVGYYLGSGRGWSGTVSGLAVGASAFAIQTYALPALSACLQSISFPLADIELHAVGWGMTVLATMFMESIALCTTRKLEDVKELGKTKQYDSNQTHTYSAGVNVYSEYTTFAWVSKIIGDVLLPYERDLYHRW